MKQPHRFPDLVLTLSQTLRQKGFYCAVAESCTGGLIAAELTDYPGSSQWFDCGFVTYSNTSKHTLLGVPQEILDTYGAVSEETVIAMAIGALHYSKANISVAVSGIAGPGGETVNKPVGTIWMAWAGQDQTLQAVRYQLEGSRQTIRYHCVDLALQGLIKHCDSIKSCNL